MASVTINYIDVLQGTLTWCCRQALHRGCWQWCWLVCLLVGPSGFLQSLHTQPVAFGKPCRVEKYTQIRSTLYTNIMKRFLRFFLQFTKHSCLSSSTRRSNVRIFTHLLHLPITCSFLGESQHPPWTDTS